MTNYKDDMGNYKPETATATAVETNHYAWFPAKDVTVNTEYWPFGGQTKSATESQTSSRTPVAKTFSKLSVEISLNTANIDQTFKLRDDGADTALVLTISNGTTGTFSDDVNTVAVAVNSLCNFSNGAEASSGMSNLRSITWMEKTV